MQGIKSLISCVHDKQSGWKVGHSGLIVKEYITMSKCGLKNIICLTDFINTDNFYNLEFCKKKDNSCIL